MTTLHAGGKFGGKVYDTSGGLHGVGASLVNALSEWMEVEVCRERRAFRMRFARGHAAGKLKDAGAVNRRGTVVSFKPDEQIFGKSVHFSPRALYRMARSKAYLFPLELRARAVEGRRHARGGHAQISGWHSRFPEFGN
jgi:topoisomerase-4 subunit B